MRTTCTELKNANDDLYQAMQTMTSKVSCELVHVTNARKVVTDLMAAGVRHSNGTVRAVNRAYSMISDADNMIDSFKKAADPWTNRGIKS